MRLILHIGTEKTGTTSIQKFFLKHRELLNSQSILYPKSTCGINGNHRWWPAFVYNNNFEDDFTLAKFSGDINLRKKILNEKFEEFKIEINNSDADCCLISSEQFSSRLGNNEIKNLKKILENLFDEIFIILYIRKPINYAISLLTTSIKSGGTPKGLDIEAFKKRSNLKVIKKWSNFFSGKNFKVKLFEKELFFQGDLIKDFCNEYDIKIPSELRTTIFANKSLNLLQMKSLRYLNQYFPKFNNKKLNPKRGNLTKFIKNNLHSSNYFTPTQKEFDLFESEFTREDEEIRKKYFPEKKKLWSSYNKGYANKEGILIDLSKKEIEYLNAIKELWLHIN